MKKSMGKPKKLAALLMSITLCMHIPTVVYAAQPAEQVCESDKFTEYFDEGIVFTMVEPYNNTTTSEDGIAPLATDVIARTYWGAYNTEDGEYYLQINSSTSISFKGRTKYGYVFCDGKNVQNVYFDPYQASGTNFSVSYTEYIKLVTNENGITTSTLVPKEYDIYGKYSRSDKTFTIYYITYYRQ